MVNQLKISTSWRNYFCLDYIFSFEADFGEGSRKVQDGHQPPKRLKDRRECSKCQSERVKTILEMAEDHCPKCHRVLIEETDTGCIC